MSQLETPAEILTRLKNSPLLLEAKNLSVDYLTEVGNVRACDSVNLTLHRGEILGIAGESASGKSTLLAALARLQRAPAVTSGGQVLFYPPQDNPSQSEPVDLTYLTDKELIPYRWADLSVVMQSAMACLNPVARLGDQFVDVIMAHEPTATKTSALQYAGELLEMVGIPAHRTSAYSFELSGGMQQRALIALSLACQPEVVFMDEPTTAVDVVMQRQILSQVLELQERLGFAIAFVTHDLSLLLEISDRIAIMYAGKIVEVGTAEQMYHSPRHPYTQGLRNAFPPLSEPVRRLKGIAGSPPDLSKPITGCPFAPRCEHRIDICSTTQPPLRTYDSGQCACHVVDAAAGASAMKASVS